MADWGYETGDALTQKKWRKDWWMEAKTMSFFEDNGYIGTDETNSFIVRFDDLEKDQGDQITYGQLVELSGGGVTGDSVLEGNEEEPSEYDDAVTLNQKRNAIRSAGMLSGQRPSDKKFRMHAKELLSRWIAERIDLDLFTDLSTSFTKTIWGGDATTTATIESGDYMTLNLIGQAATFAEKTSPEIQGRAMGGGERMWACVMSPDQAYDVMERDSAWAQAQREAMQRGGDNPIFKNALGVWRNTILHKHKRVPLATTWGSGANLNGASAIFMGIKAGVIAYAKQRVSNEKTFDYNNKLGIMVGAIYGTSKTVFNSTDNAVIGIRTFRSNN